MSARVGQLLSGPRARSRKDVSYQTRVVVSDPRSCAGDMMSDVLLPLPSSLAVGDDSADIARRPLHAPHERVRVVGRRFRAGEVDWCLKGFTYGPFRPNTDGEFLPERGQLLSDLAHMRALGCNAIRLYHRPPLQLLD